MVADAFGSSETGQIGGAPPVDDPFGAPRLHVDERTDVFDDDLRPGRARLRRDRTPGPRGTGAARLPG